MQQKRFGNQAFTPAELRVLRKMRTPAKVQDFLEELPENFELHGETCMSPRRVLQTRRAHCIEGALLAAAAFRLQGRSPLIVDMRAASFDQDHVIAVFREDNCWGAVSKTNHAVLRYREPVYKTIRELMMSFFHEYFTDDGRRSLRSFSGPLNLQRFDRHGWMTSEKELWYIGDALNHMRHFSIPHPARFRGPDRIEVAAGKLLNWKVRNRRVVRVG